MRTIARIAIVASLLCAPALAGQPQTISCTDSTLIGDRIDTVDSAALAALLDACSDDALKTRILDRVNAAGEGHVQAGRFSAAARLYEVAAQRGHAQSQSNLGFLYLNGLGVEARSFEKAVELFQRSAAQENAFGKANLARMYETGRGGLERSLDKARELYEAAAAGGNPYAAERLTYLARQRGESTRPAEPPSELGSERVAEETPKSAEPSRSLRAVCKLPTSYAGALEAIEKHLKADPRATLEIFLPRIGDRQHYSLSLASWVSFDAADASTVTIAGFREEDRADFDRAVRAFVAPICGDCACSTEAFGQFSAVRDTLPYPVAATARIIQSLGLQGLQRIGPETALHDALFVSAEPRIAVVLSAIEPRDAGLHNAFKQRRLKGWEAVATIVAIDGDGNAFLQRIRSQPGPLSIGRTKDLAERELATASWQEMWSVEGELWSMGFQGNVDITSIQKDLQSRPEFRKRLRSKDMVLVVGVKIDRDYDELRLTCNRLELRNKGIRSVGKKVGTVVEKSVVASPQPLRHVTLTLPPLKRGHYRVTAVGHRNDGANDNQLDVRDYFYDGQSFNVF